jgi:hypothetical protein
VYRWWFPTITAMFSFTHSKLSTTSTELPIAISIVLLAETKTPSTRLDTSVISSLKFCKTCLSLLKKVEDIKAVIRRLNKDRQEIGRKKMDIQRSAKHYTLK